MHNLKPHPRLDDESYLHLTRLPGDLNALKNLRSTGLPHGAGELSEGVVHRH